MRKRRKGSNFLEQIKRARDAKAQSKPISEMSEAELDAEISKLRGELHSSKREAAEAAREELASRQKGPVWFADKKRRPYWK